MVIHARGNVNCPVVLSVLEKDSEPRGMTIAPDDCEETKKQRKELWELLDNFAKEHRIACYRYYPDDPFQCG